MNFNRRLTLSFVTPALLFVLSLSGSILAMRHTQAQFDQYLNTEQAVANGVTDMYAQGLQMGQALRNVLLDPANAKAYKNLEAARAAFDQAHKTTVAAARDTAGEPGLAPLAALRARQAEAQDKVLALSKTDTPKAIELLNREETPAWRELRGQLLALGEASRKQAALTHEAVNAQADRARWTAIVMALLAVLSAAALGLLVRRTLSREIGGDPALARALLRRIADGDLGAETPAGADPGSLMGAVASMQVSMRSLVQQVHQSSAGIDMACREIATGNHDLSVRTEQAAAQLQQTAGSLQLLTGNVRQSADAAAQANQLAANASAVAERGGAVVAEVVSTMDQINQSSKRIADIIGTIDGIAFQTNILALNAAVEAARAGEQGRGFAVVASEVRSLAQRSAEAAREIKGLIGSSVDKVETGARLVRDAGATMVEIVTSVQRVTDVIGEISAASTEQRGSIEQVNGAVSHLDQMTQQNAALVEQSAAAAESLREQAKRLVAVVGGFKLVADGGATGVAVMPAPARISSAAPTKSPTPRPATPQRPAPRPAQLAQTAIHQAQAGARPAPRAGDGDWESF